MAGARAFLAGSLTLAAAACLVLGLTKPILTVSKFYFWSETYTLVGVVEALWASREYALAVTIAAFSFAFPLLKLLYLMAAIAMRGSDGGAARALRQLGWLGKWLMLDVLVLALVVFAAKQSGLADAFALPGIYYFGAAVVLTMVAYAMVEHADMAQTLPAQAGLPQIDDLRQSAPRG